MGSSSEVSALVLVLFTACTKTTTDRATKHGDEPQAFPSVGMSITNRYFTSLLSTRA